MNQHHAVISTRATRLLRLEAKDARLYRLILAATIQRNGLRDEISLLRCGLTIEDDREYRAGRLRGERL